MVVLATLSSAGLHAHANNLSDFRVQPGSISLNTTTLRSEPITPAYQEASPRARVSFRIQQLGSFPGGLDLGLPYSFEFTSASGQVFYRDFAPLIVSVQTNSTTLVEQDVFPVNGMPFGSYTLRVILDRNSQRTDLDRSNNTAVISSSILYIQTFRFDIDHISRPNGAASYAAGDTVNFEYTVVNFGEDGPLPFSVVVPVDIYLTTTPYRGGINGNTVSRQRVLSNPDTYYIGRESAVMDATTTSSFPLPADLDALEWHIAAIPNPIVSVPESVTPIRSDIGFTDTPFEARYVFERPNLYIDFIENVTPLQTTPGQTLTVSGRYGNNTEFPAPQGTTLNHYLVDESSFDLQYYLGSSATQPLIAAPVGGSVTLTYSESFIIPSDIPAGRDYRYRVTIDEADLVDERFEGGSAISRDPVPLPAFTEPQDYLIRVNPLPLPDLGPDPADRFTTLSTTSGEPGDPLTLSASVKNFPPLGNALGAPSATFEIAFFAVGVSTPSDEAFRLPIGRTTVTQPIPIGDTLAINFPTSIPDLPPGQYRVGYVIDPDGEVAENTFYSNTSLDPTLSNLLQILPPTPTFPDLVVGGFDDRLPEQADYEAEIALAFEVVNLGNGDAAPSQLRISLLSRPGDPSSAVFSQIFAVPAIPAGGSEEMEVAIEVPEPPEDPSTLVGSFDWRIEVGINLAESDETNNIHPLERSRLRLLPSDQELYPQLVPTKATLSPGSIIAGTEINTTFQLLNEGFYGASQVEVEVYLSAGGNFDPETSLLLERISPFDLAGDGGSRLITDRLRLPNDVAAGQYEVVWLVDPGQAIPQVDPNPQLFAAAPLEVRALNLRLEVLEYGEDSTAFILHDARDGREYALRYGPNPAELELDLETRRTGKDNQPMIFEIPLGTDELPAFFAQAVQLD